MKMTFSYFPGMYENPAPAKYYQITNIMKNKIHTNASKNNRWL